MFGIKEDDKKALYRRVRRRLVGSVFDLEITDEDFDDYFLDAVEEYQKIVYDWLTQQQWGDIIGKEIDGTDFSFYLMTRTLDFERSFTYAYSKQVGHGTNSPWEMKEDSIKLSAGTQDYIIPAGREVSEVLWYTKPNVDTGRLVASADNQGVGANFGFASNQHYGFPINHVYNIVSNSQDIQLRNRIYSYDLSYKIVGGFNGTKILKLYPVPGGKYDLAKRGSWYNLFVGDKENSLDQTVVYYYYYDTTEVVECYNDNPDIVMIPGETPFNGLKWSRLNDTAKTWIREMLLAITKLALSNIRGYYSGEINVDDSQIRMDYQKLAAEGTEEKKTLKDKLYEDLEKMSWVELMKKKSEIAEYTNKVLGFIPNKTVVG